MARIRTAEVHGHFHRLPIALIVTIVLLATGGTLFGLSQTVWKSVQGVQNPIILPPPVEPVITPATTPTQTSTPTPVPPATIEVKWEIGESTNKLPVNGFVVENEGISYFVTGKPYVWFVWKTENGGKNWQLAKEQKYSPDFRGPLIDISLDAATIHFDTDFRSPWIPNEQVSKFSERLINAYKFPSTYPYDFRFAVDSNNKDNILATWLTLTVASKRVFLSQNGGQSWTELLPPPAEKEEGDVCTLAIASFQNQLKIYVGFMEGYTWQTTIYK